MQMLRFAQHDSAIFSHPHRAGLHSRMDGGLRIQDSKCITLMPQFANVRKLTVSWRPDG